MRRLVAIVSLFALSGCGDPLHEDAVEKLGPERRGVREGPNHRPGQPCVTCHGGRGPAIAEFAVAGTVYFVRGTEEPIETTVEITDATGETRNTRSNVVGNFYIGTDTWRPKFPLRALLRDSRAEHEGAKAMQNPIQRSGSCATCHYGGDFEGSHMPPVYLRNRP